GSTLKICMSCCSRPTLPCTHPRRVFFLRSGSDSLVGRLPGCAFSSLCSAPPPVGCCKDGPRLVSLSWADCWPLSGSACSVTGPTATGEEPPPHWAALWSSAGCHGSVHQKSWSAPSPSASAWQSLLTAAPMKG